MAATMTRPLGGVPCWWISKAQQRKASIGARSASGRVDDELCLTGVVRDAAQRHSRGVPPGAGHRVRRERDELPEDASQPDYDPFLIAGGSGDRKPPGGSFTLRPYLDAEDIIRAKQEVKLGLTVIQDGVHQQRLHTARSSVRQSPCKSVGNGGQGDDGALVEGGMDLRT